MKCKGTSMSLMVTHQRLPHCGDCTARSQHDPSVVEENQCICYQCTDCGLIYVSPLPAEDAIANLYGHDDAHVSADELIASTATYGRLLKAKMSLQLVREHVTSGDLLEIGAGGGGFLQEAAKHGYNVFAAEFNPIQVEHIRSLGFDCRQGSFSEAFKGMTFDVIYHCDVLSHLRDPVAEFKAMRAMLRPGGVMVFETGNFGDVARERYHLIERWQCPTHLYFFSRRSLANLARASGFKLEKIVEHSRTLDMRVARVLKPARSSLHSTAKQAPSNGEPSRTHPAKRSLVHLIMSAKHLFDFFSIYKLGRILPKERRPQTVIAVFKP